ncbi:hypothetical protein LY76DRAFT_400974 [Colletotrichum caudatum]|nr:hypothetical protein LY76DRAFT_400974 [Colletotrichum caudatum]
MALLVVSHPCTIRLTSATRLVDSQDWTLTGDGGFTDHMFAKGLKTVQKWPSSRHSAREEEIMRPCCANSVGRTFPAESNFNPLGYPWPGTLPDVTAAGRVRRAPFHHFTTHVLPNPLSPSSHYVNRAFLAFWGYYLFPVLTSFGALWRCFALPLHGQPSPQPTRSPLEMRSNALDKVPSRPSREHPHGPRGTLRP